MALGGRSRAEARDRVVVVAEPDEVAALELELHALAGAPRVDRRPAAPSTRRSPARAWPSSDWPREPPTVARARPRGPGRTRHRRPGGRAARARRAGAVADAVLRGVARQAARSPSSSGPRCSSTSARCTAPATGGPSGSSTCRSRCVGCVVLVVADPVSCGRQPGRQPGPAASTGRSGSARAARLHHPQVPHDGAAGRRATLVNEWTAENDPRITRFGRVLRVDPPRRAAPGRQHPPGRPRRRRPAAGAAARTSTSSSEKLPFYPLRHLVRPGLTGWAQVKYGYAGNESDALEKLQYEFWYLRHQSLRTDARIIGRTDPLGVRRRGRGAVTEPAARHGDRARARRGRRHRGCLDAIAAQDYPVNRLEVIVVDGCSTDGTAEVARGGAGKAGASARRRSSRTKGATASSNLNVGLSQGDGRDRLPGRRSDPDRAALRADVRRGARSHVPRSRSSAEPRSPSPETRPPRAVGIARALNNRWSMGGSPYRRATRAARPTPCTSARSAADELVRGRWMGRAAGIEPGLRPQPADVTRGVVWFDASTSLRLPSADPRGTLWRQYLRFGRAKVTYWRVTGERPQRRQWVAYARASCDASRRPACDTGRAITSAGPGRARSVGTGRGGGNRG